MFLFLLCWSILVDLSFRLKGIYGLGCIVAAITRPRDGPLMAMLISLIISAMSGCGPRLVSVKTWHLEWFWYIWPAVSSQSFYSLLGGLALSDHICYHI